AFDDALTESGGHDLGLIGVDVQLLSDLLVGEVQPHEVQAQDPDPQRLMVPGEDGPTEVIESLAAAMALVYDPNAITELRATVVIPYAPTNLGSPSPIRRS